MREFIVAGTDAGQRLDKYIKRLLPDAGTGFIYKMLRKKNITLNAKRAEGNELLKAGDRIVFYLSGETYDKFAGATVSFQEQAQRRLSDFGKAYDSIERRYHGIRIAYEDDHILVAVKPAGLLSQKSEPADLSLNDWFVGYLLEKGAVSMDSIGFFMPSIANRLDRNTGGLVLCAKTLSGSRSLSAMLRERTLHKYYQMIVVGNVTEPGVMEDYLSKDAKTNQVYVHEKTGIKEGASFAKTIYRPLQYSSDNNLTLLEAELVTGKTHQLRAQFSHAGHPILGDGKYGNAKANARYQPLGIHGQLLYCVRIEFPDGRIVSTDPPLVFQRVMS